MTSLIGAHAGLRKKWSAYDAEQIMRDITPSASCETAAIRGQSASFSDRFAARDEQRCECSHVVV